MELDLFEPLKVDQPVPAAELGEKLTGLEIPQARGGAPVTIQVPVHYVLR